MQTNKLNLINIKSTTRIALIYFSILFFSCSNNNNPSQDGVKGSLQKDHLDKLDDSTQHSAKTNQAKTDTIALYPYVDEPPLPFGCELLSAYNNKTPKRNNQNESSNQDIYFWKDCGSKRLRNVELCSLPKINSYEFIKVGEMLPCLYSLGLDSCMKYKIPDIGPYKCYFLLSYVVTRNSNRRYPDINMGNSPLGEYGRLLLYDEFSKKAKILPIYYYLLNIGDYYSEGRFFNVDKNNTIHIYRIEHYDGDCETGEGGGCYVYNTYNISISNNGETNITAIK